MSINYFDSSDIAEIYARNRPYLHAVFSKRIREVCRADLPFRSALDVGCGTGHSSMALHGIAERIVGVDVSEPMIREADTHRGIEYALCPAETLPFKDRAFDLVTVGLAMHWFDRRSFFSEANRVLQPEGWFLIYNIWFAHSMKENPAFQEWFDGEFLVRYPNPPRHRGPLTDETLQEHGFSLVRAEELETTFPMTRQSFVDFLLTMSNIIAVREREDPEVIGQWLEESLVDLMPEQGTFQFAGFINYLRKS